MAILRSAPKPDAAFKMPARGAAIFLVVLIHLGMFFALAPRLSIARRQLAHEVVLLFPKATQELQNAPAIQPNFVAPNESSIQPPVIQIGPEPAVPMVPQPDITGLGQSLFGCDLANSKNVSHDERRNCLHIPMARAAPQIGMPKTTRALQSARWAAELAARKQPAEAPCAHIQSETIGTYGANQRQSTILMADPLCFLNLLTGSAAK